MLAEQGRLRRCFTQNIDSLEAIAPHRTAPHRSTQYIVGRVRTASRGAVLCQAAAGVPAELIVAAHGNFDGCKCVRAPSRVVAGRLAASRRATPALAVGSPGASRARQVHRDGRDGAGGGDAPRHHGRQARSRRLAGARRLLLRPSGCHRHRPCACRRHRPCGRRHRPCDGMRPRGAAWTHWCMRVWPRRRRSRRSMAACASRTSCSLARA